MNRIWIITHEWSVDGDRDFSVVKPFDDFQKAKEYLKVYFNSVKKNFLENRGIEEFENDRYGTEIHDCSMLIECGDYNNWEEVRIITTTIE